MIDSPTRITAVLLVQEKRSLHEMVVNLRIKVEFESIPVFFFFFFFFSFSFLFRRNNHQKKISEWGKEEKVNDQLHNFSQHIQTSDTS